MSVIFTYGPDTYSLPTGLDEIDFQTWLDYIDTHGADLIKRRLEYEAMPEGDERALHERMLLLDEAYSYVSAFTGIPLDDLQENALYANVLNVYALSEVLYINETRDIPILPEYFWEGDTWQIQPPTRSISSDGATLQEFADSMKLARYMIAYAEKEEWINVLPLLCAYFRKEDEPYTTDLITPEGERWSLLKSLPMDMVMGTLYYLSSTLVLFCQNLDDYTTLQNPPE